MFQPQRNIFMTKLLITALPNHGAGVGHQFDEWIQVSAYWNKFLYFHLNEILEKDLLQHFRTVHVKDYYNTDSSNLSVKSWIVREQQEFLKYAPRNHAMLLRFHCLSTLVYVKEAACFSPINVQLRMKYCAARLIEPVRVNLYHTDRAFNRFIVAIHLRCGDSCYDSYRATSLSSMENTIMQIHFFIRQYYSTREAVFHLFSQPPINSTAEQHFRTLTHNENFRKLAPYPIRIASHFSLSDPITLHHLIMADLLLTAQSGFSLLAAILRIGVTFGPITSCQPKLGIHDYDKKTGNFSWYQIQQALNLSETIKAITHTANYFNPHSPESCLIHEKNKDIW